MYWFLIISELFVGMCKKYIKYIKLFEEFEKFLEDIWIGVVI